MSQLRTLIPVTTILLFLPVVSRAADPPPSTLHAQPSTSARDELPQLLKQLDADTRAERLAAERKLIELGPAILPQLPPPELLPTAAVRDAVARVRNELELRQARDSVQPSRVTAKGTKSLADWLTEISRQTGNAVDGNGLTQTAREKQLTLDLDGVPFWGAMDRITTQPDLNWRVQIDEKTNVLKFMPRDESTPRELAVADAGAYRAAVLSMQKRTLFGVAKRELLRVQMSLVPEPRLRPLFLQFAAADIVASTSAGKLPPLNPAAKYELPLNSPGREARLQLDYYRPAGDAVAEIDLRGKFTVTTAAGSEQIRFTNMKQVATEKNPSIARRRGGVTVTLQRAAFSKDAPHGDQFHARVAVAYDAGGPAFESHRSWMLHNQVYLETPDGTRLELNGGYETTLQTDGTTGIEYRFLDLPAAADFTFVYVAPTLIIDVPVDVQLKWVK